MRLSFIAALVCLCGMSVSGCATITRGASEDVQFISSPPGARVKTSAGPECTTPCTIRFDRRATFDAVFTLGEQKKTVPVDTEVAGGGVVATAGNIIVGGIVGVGVDIATGAGLDHVPNPVTVTFEPVPSAPAERGGSAPATMAEAPTAPATETTHVGKDGFRWENGSAGA